MEITEKDLENPQRFVAEGLGAPEARIKQQQMNREAKALRADRIHPLCTNK